MAENAQRRGRGCFYYGCLTMILVFIGVMAGIYFGTRQAVKFAVEQYTSSSPASVPKLAISDDEAKKVAAAVQDEARSKSRLGGTLVLGERELNALLANSPELGKFRSQIYLQPEGDLLNARISLPLDQFEAWKTLGRRLLAPSLAGRYLNGVATLEAGAANGVLNVSLRDLKVNGKSLPENFIVRLRGQNLLADFHAKPEFQEWLRKIEKIEIRGGKVYIEFKAATRNDRVVDGGRERRRGARADKEDHQSHEENRCLGWYAYGFI